MHTRRMDYKIWKQCVYCYATIGDSSFKCFCLHQNDNLCFFEFFKGAMGDASPILFKFSTGLGAPKQHSCLTLMPDYSVAITPYKQEQNQHWFWDGVHIRYANLENAVLCCRNFIYTCEISMLLDSGKYAFRKYS